LPANATYVQAVPDTHRARAMGLAQVGLALTQGLALLLAGLAAQVAAVPDVVAVTGGIGLLTVGALRWREPEPGTAPFGAGPIARRD
ncbi:MAG: hypothetical protein ACYDAQ_20595, partial [Mycobacteriales bacterium]